MTRYFSLFRVTRVQRSVEPGRSRPRSAAVSWLLVAVVYCGCNGNDAPAPSSRSTVTDAPHGNKIVLKPRPGQLIVEGSGGVYIIGKSSEDQPGPPRLAENLEGSGGMHVIGKSDDDQPGPPRQAENIKDTKTYRMAWPALTCVDKDCTGQGKEGQPFLFYRKSPRAHLDAEGNLTWGKKPDLTDSEAVLEGKVKCPACGSGKGVRNYVAPEVQARQDELMEELKQSRAASRARRRGETVSGKHRTPKEIMDEMASLPQVYLAEEE
ncbi:MAG: hypothetical protein WBF93_16425 [Pirellulales bacterium]